jgi:la-related protein 6
VKRNKEGFVNLKLLASFKKMRSLSRDYRVIGEALKDSTKLVVNENGLKIRRASPLPKELLDQARVKNLVVSKMPNDNPSMDYVIAAFPGHKDDVISVRVVKPGKKFPNDLQSHFSRHPELKDQIVAVVEFDSPESAAAAIKNIDKSGYQGMDVKLLELGPKQAKRMSNNNSEASDTPIDSDSGGAKKNGKKKTGNRLLEVNGHGQDDSSYASSSDSDWSSFSSCSKRYSRSHGGSKSPSPSTSPKCRSPIEMYSPRNKLSTNDSPKSPQKGRRVIDHSPIRKMSPLAAMESPRSSPEAQRKFGGKHETEKGGDRLSPWMFQRMQLTKNTENDICSQKHLEVIRQPKGPDGSFGFSNHPLKKYVLVHAY